MGESLTHNPVIYEVLLRCPSVSAQEMMAERMKVLLAQDPSLLVATYREKVDTSRFRDLVCDLAIEVEKLRIEIGFVVDEAMQNGRVCHQAHLVSHQMLFAFEGLVHHLVETAAFMRKHELQLADIENAEPGDFG